MKSKCPIIIFLSIIILNYSCSSNHDFYREKELFHFLKINNIQLSSGNSVVLLLVGSGCGTCLESTKEILKQLPDNQIHSLIVILGGEMAQREYSPLISSTISTINTNIDTLTAKGLLFPADIVFFIKGSSHISKLVEINTQSKPYIINELNKGKYNK